MIVGQDGLDGLRRTQDVKVAGSSLFNSNNDFFPSPSPYYKLLLRIKICELETQ